MLAQVIRETGFKKAEDFYVALGSGKLQSGQIVNKVIQRLKTDEVAEEPIDHAQAAEGEATRSPARRSAINVPGVEDVLVRLAKCCTPVPGDAIVGYISLGKRDHDPPRGLPEREGADAEPGAVHAGRVGGRRVAELPRPDRGRGLGPRRGCSRTSRGRSPSTARTSSPTAASVEDQMAKNWYTAEIGDVKDLRSLLTALRNIEAVFDAYRVTPQ